MSRSECQPRDGTQRLAGSARLSALPLAALAGGSIGASLPTFHVKAADRARVAYMPGTAWPVTGSPPDSSWNLVLAPVLMPPETNFDTSTAIRLRSPSRSPPDASCAPFPTRSRQRSSANAAVGGLTPLPEERRRRATTFIFHAAAQSIEVTYLHPDLSFLRAWHTLDAASCLRHGPGLGRCGQHACSCQCGQRAACRDNHHREFGFHRARVTGRVCLCHGGKWDTWQSLCDRPLGYHSSQRGF